MKLCFTLGFLLLAIIGSSQHNRNNPEKLNSYFGELWNLYNTNNEGSQISIPFTSVNKNKISTPILFEGRFSPYFIVTRGKAGYSYNKFGQSLMVYIQPDFIFRMYQKDTTGASFASLPVRPINFCIKAGVVKFFYPRGIDATKPDVNRYQYAHFLVSHYSNGQADPHFLQDTAKLNGDSLANFVSGNFSTNFWQLGFSQGFRLFDENVFSYQLTYQNDFGTGGVFSYDDSQEKRYGHHRLKGCLQLQSKPIEFRLAGNSYHWTVRLYYRPEVILDNVSSYFGNSKNRMSNQFGLMMHNVNWRNLGFNIEYYTGRDYYNIRYYDHIRQLKIGLIADTHFYIPRTISKKY